MADDIIPSTKVCTKCGNTYPATTEYFNRTAHQRFRGECKTCQKVYANNWYAKNRAEIQAKHKAYDAEHKAERKAYMQRYRAEHREERRLYNKKYREERREWWRETIKKHQRANPEKHREWMRKSRLKHIDKRREEGRRYYAEHGNAMRLNNHEWYRKNKDASRAKSHKRRALKAQSGGVHTPTDIQLLLKSQKGKCWWCGKLIDPDNYHVDHRIPLSRGGSNAPENLCISCPKCNLSKGDKLPHEWSDRLL